MPASSIRKRDFRCFFGLVMGTTGKNANISCLKTEFPWFFELVTGTSCENGMSVIFLDL